jgi:outer membrane immunogenic protein
MKEVIMGRVSFASLTSTSVVATVFAATPLVAVHAADLGPMVTKAPPAPVCFNWTGFYAGVNLGGSWGHQSDQVFDGNMPPPPPPPPPPTPTVPTILGGGVTDHPDGVIGGGQIGYNWGFCNSWGWGNGWVIGIEADFDGSGQRTTDNFDFVGLGGSAFSGSFTDRLQWFGTVRGRVGIAFDRVFPYVTAGWAYGNRTFDGTLTVNGVTNSFDASTTLTDGWTVGGGVEWAFWDHWTAKFEYLYIDFGNRNDNNNFIVLTTPASPVNITTGHFTDNVVRAGVNYRF